MLLMCIAVLGRRLAVLDGRWLMVWCGRRLAHAGERGIDLVLGEVLGLQEGQALFEGRSGDGGILEDCLDMLGVVMVMRRHV